MSYRVLRPFGAHQTDDLITGDGYNLNYLIANGMIELVNAQPATTNPAKAARTTTKKRKD